MKRWIRDNGLSLVLLAMFLASIGGHTAAGFRVAVQDAKLHGEDSPSLSAYVRSGEYIESVSENWESEFLQMGMFVLLTVWLIQRGSQESNDADNPADPEVRVPADQAPRLARWTRSMPWLYDHSLSITFFGLFAISFVIHLASGARAESAAAAAHGEPGVSMLDYLFSARMWFESLQNWQSEFLSVAAIVVLAVFMRERGSPESKPVERIVEPDPVARQVEPPNVIAPSS